MADIFNINELIYQVNAGMQETQPKPDAKSIAYKDALDQIRHTISKHHSAELIDVLHSPQAGERLKNMIVRYLVQSRITVKSFGNIADLADKIYEDMAGFGVLTKYLQDETVEEININSWNSIEVLYPNNEVVFLPDAFLSPSDCTDKIKKMAWFGGKIIDGTLPIADSFIGEGVRISGIIPPCTDKRTGGVASIRLQKENIITRELLIQYGSATEEELDFLNLCINHGVSLAIAGNTGSGKTTDLAYLISCLDSNKRIYTIEDTRELNIARFDDAGRMTNRVVQTLTKDGDKPVSMDDLLKVALRFHPYIIIPAEMRGKEALTAIEAGRTGHVIMSTFHANSAVDAYNRILSMYNKAQTGLSENKILEFVLEAIPLILFKRQLPDGRRVYDEIFEGISLENGRIKGHTLYKYDICTNRHVKKHNLSEQLRTRLLYGGASESEINKFIEGG